MLRKLSLVSSYWIAFIILVMWATFAFITMHSLIDSHKQYGTLINLSGKQRMLSQKTALHAHLIVEHADMNTSLLKLLKTMKEDHRFITSNLMSDRIRDYYFGSNGLDEQVKHYFGMLDTFVLHPDKKEAEEITRYSFDLLEKLNHAVSLFETENTLIVNNLKRREFYIYIGTLITLLVEALVIILPMIRTQNKYVGELEKEIRKRTRDIRIFANIFENAKEGMFITDAKQQIIDINKEFTNITGYTKKEVVGKTPRVLSSKKHDQLFYEKMWRAIESEHIWQGEIINRRKDGKEFHEHATILKLQNDETVNYVGVFTDITDQVRHRETLQYKASHDSLTGLYNRNEILSRLEHAIALTDHTQTSLALVFVDLDNFKFVNDTFGHHFGDKLLVAIAKKLSEIVRRSDTLGRLGGDEFVILFENLQDEEDENIPLEKIKAFFMEPVEVEGKLLPVGASIGVAFHTNHENSTCDAQCLLRKADIAMYKAKESGKNRVVFYSDELSERLRFKHRIENQLKDAFPDDELELYLQPQINFETGKVRGAEALLRWNMEGEVVFPDQFIPVAEESRIIQSIDLWVVAEGLRILKEVHQAGYKDFILALNLSGRTFCDSEMIDKILDVIIYSDLAPFIEIEITESILMENLFVAAHHIERITSCGARVSLDNFGTGYFSLSSFGSLPLNTLKIDRSLIGSLDEGDRQQVLIEAIIALSRKLGIEVVAEGIETKIQYDWLYDRESINGQGNYIAKPMKLQEFKAFLINAGR